MPTLLLFLLGLAMLICGGQGTVAHLDALARIFRISRFNIAFLLIAFATSLPELFVGISAAFANVPLLSAGNVFGSNIVDSTLVLGLPILLAGRLLLKSNFLRDASISFAGITLFPFALFLDGTLSRLDGIALILTFGIAVRHMLHHHRAPASLDGRAAPALSARMLLLFLISIIGLLLGAHLVVDSSMALAASFSISPFMLGLLAVALGTSLPELAFNLMAVRKGKGDFVLGDTAGSMVCNATVVLGLTAVLQPITIAPQRLLFPFLMTALALLLMLIPLHRHKYYSRTIGIGMLVLYGVFLFGEFR